MGAIMYSFAYACNPLISKNFALRSRGCVPTPDALFLILRIGLDLGFGEGNGRSFFWENAWVWSLKYLDAGLLDSENASTPSARVRGRRR
jgi:hypothetical protein